MAPELRPVAEDEYAAFLAVDTAAFGVGPFEDDEAAAWRELTPLDRTLAVFEGPQPVAAAAAMPMELTVPGPATTPAAGVTLVAVKPTHRRQGLLTAMMGRQLAHVREIGEPVAVLFASESLIYGRYGYGMAASQTAVELDRLRCSFLQPPAADGRVVLVEADQAAVALPAVFERARRRQPGDVERKPGHWTMWLRDTEKEREGASPLFFALHQPAAGDPDGYATYRVKERWDHNVARNRVVVQEVVAATVEAESALWRFVLSLDLTEVVEARPRPLDDPLRWLLADPRQLRVTELSDSLWLRVVDVPAALAARRYAVAGRLVLEVADHFCPWTDGRYLLEAGADGAECRPTDREADLALGAAELGAVYLGGVRPSALGAVGRVQERRPGALALADAMLASQPLPFCRTEF